MRASDLVHAYRCHYNEPLGRLFYAAGCPTEHHGDGSYVYDDRGNRYLDWCSGYGVFGLGHGNAALVSSARQQMHTLAWLPAGCPHNGVQRLRNRLAPLLPPSLNQVMLAGSGSEAIEYALLTLLTQRTRRTRIVAAENSYHGKTLGALCLMGQPALRLRFGPLGLAVTFVPYGDLNAMRAAVDDDTLAVFLEPVLGGGHLTVPPPGYLAGVASLCRAHGTRLVLDEVQTGFGRTGRMFAFEREGITPDILVTSKTITGGCIPIALTIVDEEIIRTHPAPGTLPEPSWQGSLVACATAAASIEYLVTRGIPHQVEEKGRYLHERLTALATQFPTLIVDAPGIGLMLGARVRSVLVEHALWLQLLSRGVIGGLSTNTAVAQPVLRVFPPLTTSYEEIDAGLAAMTDALETLRRWPAILLKPVAYAFAAQHYLPAALLRAGCLAFKLKLLSRGGKKTVPAVPVSEPSR